MIPCANNKAVRIRESTILKLVRRIQELEKKGYECIKPFQSFYRTKKEYVPKVNKARSGYKFNGVRDQLVFEVYMRKKEA